MALLYMRKDGPLAAWREALGAELPDLEFRVWPEEVGDPREIEFALVWHPPPGALKRFPNLRAILSMGAGVDHVLKDPELPAAVPIVRLVDPTLTADMSVFVITLVLYFHRDLRRYTEFQRAGRWQKLPYPPIGERRVGILGLGELGADAARRLKGLGFAVAGWSRTPKTLEGIAGFHGETGLRPFLARTEILICLLPLTAATAGIINAATLAALPPGAAVINVGRGGHVVDADLVAALDSGHLAGAALDVFQIEPLAADHPFWHHPKVLVTPHIASITNPRTAAAEVAADIRRLRAGRPARHLVDPRLSY